MGQIMCSNCQRFIDKSEYIDDGGNGVCDYCIEHEDDCDCVECIEHEPAPKEVA